jgi:hypothetical protein
VPEVHFHAPETPIINQTSVAVEAPAPIVHFVEKEKPSIGERLNQRLPTARSKAVASVAVVALLTGGGYLGWKKWGEAAPLSEMVTVENVDEGYWPESGQVYWVPATADVESIPPVEWGCGKAHMQWLKDNGASRQWVPNEIVVTNNVIEEGSLAVSNVRAHGVVSYPSTPGFLFYCTNQGGGPLDTVSLNLEMRDGQRAELRESPTDSTYFLYKLERDDALSIALFPDGNQDFSGTVTMDLRKSGHEDDQVVLPMSSDGSTEVAWKGVPDDKYLVVSPGFIGEDALECGSDPSERGGVESCDREWIRTRLTELWGEQ